MRLLFWLILAVPACAGVSEVNPAAAAKAAKDKAAKAQIVTLGDYASLTNAIHQLPKTKDWAVVADVLLRLYNAGTLSAEAGKPEKDKTIKSQK